MELDAADAVAQVDQRRTGVRLDHAARLAGRGHAPDAGRDLFLLRQAGGEIEIGAAAGGIGQVGVPALLAGGEQSLHVGGNRFALLLHALHRGGNADRIPQLERPHLPVVAQAHGAVDFDEVAADFGNAVGRVGEQLGEQGPEKLPRLVELFAAEAGQQAQPLAQRIDILGHLQRGKLGTLRGAVFERLPVDGEAGFAFFRALLAVEAAAGFVAQQLALDHLPIERGQFQNASLIGRNIIGHALDAEEPAAALASASRLEF